VLREAQGRGVAKALTDEGMRLILAGQVKEVLTTVKPTNSPVLRMLKRHNFELLREEDDYFGPGEKRLVMRWRANS
jgi:ribosomal protein S18 acetylase RimI-like enzyme